MKERINRLANGAVEYQQRELVLSHQDIEERVYGAGNFKGEFHISAADESVIKGLVYSTSAFVYVVNHAFGGRNNRIQYEVRADRGGAPEEIAGAFHLVTSCGEVLIPYRFLRSAQGIGKPLGSLVTLADFANLALEKPDAALGIFDYAEFVKMPFMQDMTIRSIYDSIHGKGNREQALESFLVGTAAKDGIEITVDKENFLISASEEDAILTVGIEKSTWGYLQLKAVAETPFLILEKERIYNNDFHGNSYDLKIHVKSGLLHPGRNYGKVHLIAPCKTINISIIIVREGTAESQNRSQKGYKQSFQRYLELRLDYESGLYEEAQLLDKMETELLKMMGKSGETLTALLLAENYILQNRPENACLILDEKRDSILQGRLEAMDIYCFYQYLQSRIAGRDGQADSLLRLLRKYNDEKENQFYLYLLLLKMDESMFTDRDILLERLRELFAGGTRSPFLYLLACQLFNEEPILLRKLEAFELQILHFGMKREMIGEDLAVKAAELASLEKGCRKFFLQILEGLYKKYEQVPVLEGICSILIKGNLRSPEFFTWFAKGVEAGLKLTRLFEHYLYTLPGNFDQMLPKEVLLYFSYPNSLGKEELEALYYNILTYVEPGTPIYQAYERQLEEFALASLFDGRINDKLAAIYRRMIYKDLIDEKIARVFPELLRSHRIECQADFITHAVISYEALKEKVIVPVKDGVAYAPMYVTDCLILFQDGYGNRYMEVDYRISRLMEEPELEERCFDMCKDHLMLQLRTCKEILKREAIEPEEILLVEGLLAKGILHELYEEQMLSLLVKYYSQSEEEKDYDMMISLDKGKLSGDDRILCIEALINHKHYKEAYDMIGIYGYEGVKKSRLLKLCSKMVLHHLFDEDALLLSLGFKLFTWDLVDNVVLDYLCEHYNGLTGEMYQVLLKAVELHVETYSLEERLVGQMLFTGDVTHLDEVFKLYVARKEVRESILKAYLTIKSHNFFVHGESIEPDYMEYIETSVNKLLAGDKAPLIWRLALVRYYSECPELSDGQRALCENIVGPLVDQGLIFACMEKLSSFITLPRDLIGKKIIEFRGDRQMRPYIRTMAVGSDLSHREAMNHIYEGIFVKQMMLFYGESIKYDILEKNDDKARILHSGQISFGEDGKKTEQAGKNRFALLNEISLLMDIQEDDTVRDKMIEYAVIDEMASRLFLK